MLSVLCCGMVIPSKFASRQIIILLVSCLFSFFQNESLALEPSSRIDRRAQSVAKLLKPDSFKKGTQKDLGGARGQAIRLIEELEKSQRTGSAAPASMISKAFQFRDKEIGRNQAMVTTQSLMRMWKTAVSMGLFDEKGKFNSAIKRGRGDGSDAVFEYIVPAETAPEFTRYLGNLRIVTPDAMRKGGDKPSTRDLAFLNSLNQVKSEAETRGRMMAREKSTVDQMNKKSAGDLAKQKAAKDKALYDEAVAAAGDLVDRRPSIAIEGRLGSRPSRLSKNRYRADFEVINRSRHPTEVEVDFYVLGFTDKLSEIYVMRHEKVKLQLRSSQERVHKLWTKEVNAYNLKVWELDGKPMQGKRKLHKIMYKGYIAIAKFKGDPVGYAASDARLMNYATGEKPGLEGLPNFWSE